MLSTVDFGVVVLYFIGIVILGYYCRGLVKGSLDYVLAGRQLGTLVSTATLAAGALGAFACLGLAGMGYGTGIAAFWLIIAWSAGWVILALITPRLWRTGAHSLPSILEQRFGKTTLYLSGIVSLIYIVNTLAAQMAAVGTIFSVIGSPMGINYETGAIIGAVLIMAYTIMGGLYAVAYTDLAQMFILFVGIGILLPVFSIGAAGGWASVTANVPPSLLDFWGGLAPMVILGWFISYCFTATTNPPYVQRALSAKSESVGARSQWYAMGLHALITLLVILSAIAGRVLFPNLGMGQEFVPTMIITVFPVVLSGLVLAALLALVMSTSDSYLLLTGTTTANDLYRRLKPDADDATVLRIGRWATLFWGVVALVMALWVKSVLVLFSSGAAAYGGGMFFPFMAGLFWKKATTQGANAGMILGAFTTIIWNQVLGKPYGLDGVIIGSILSGLAVYFVSIATYKEKGVQVGAAD